MTVYTLLEQTGTFRIEAARLTRAKQDILAKGGVNIQGLDDHHVEAKVSGHYTAHITFQPLVRVDCSCPDWLENGRHQQRPCKHILATALQTPLPVALQPQAPLALDSAGAGGVAPFTQQVREAVAGAIERLSGVIHQTLSQGDIPFLIGPTGSGKTSAVRAVALICGWGFEEVGGAPSFADADLVGVKMQGGTAIQGVFARAFARARAGETVLLFLDEFLRLNQRAQDVLMRPFLPTPAAVAQAMGIPTTEDVRLIEAPLWGVEWAPASRIRFVLAANPWGALVDPALIRRVLPMPVAFDHRLLGLFDPPLRDAIQASWQAVAGGELPLPLEYSALCGARRADDTSILTAYFTRLRAVDTAAAEGFRAVVEGLGVKW